MNIRGYDNWLDAPFQREMDARAEEEDESEDAYGDLDDEADECVEGLGD